MARGPATALVPVSGSAFDDEVVELACDMVRPSRGQVWVLYVIEVPRTLPLDAEVAPETLRGEQVLQHMERIGSSRKCKVEGEIIQARGMGPAVVREAEERRVDVLLAGVPYQEHYGMPTLGELVPYLLKHSPCRVVIMREEQSASHNGRGR